MENNEDREYDVILSAKLDGTKISAHRDVLSRSSSFFERMFTSGMIETNKKEITLDDIPGFMLKEVVNYCYTADLTIDNMEVLAEVADFFQLNDNVWQKSIELMSKNLCVENCMNFVLIVEKHNLKEFLRSSMKFVDLFFDSLSQLDAFDEISVNTLKNIVKRNTLEVSNEKIFFHSILKWYKRDKVNREKYLPDLMKLVQLTYLDRTFIATFFLEFSTENYCFEAVVAATEFLSHNYNSLHKRSNGRMSDRVVAFNDRTLQVYSERTNAWFTFFDEKCVRSKGIIACVDSWMEKIEYYSPVYFDGYVRKLHYLIVTCKKVKICGANKFLYAACDERFFRYDPIEDKWTDLDSSHSVFGRVDLLPSNFI